jgi:hypothetical protein
VSQDDRGDEEIQARAALPLVPMGAIADLAEQMNEDRPGQAGGGLTIVEFLSRRAPRSGILDPVESLKWTRLTWRRIARRNLRHGERVPLTVNLSDTRGTEH